eukprot:2101534-Amphidinium_carterae.1
MPFSNDKTTSSKMSHISMATLTSYKLCKKSKLAWLHKSLAEGIRLIDGQSTPAGAFPRTPPRNSSDYKMRCRVQGSNCCKEQKRVQTL